MAETLDFREVALLPHPADNAAIATGTLVQGVQIAYRDRVITLDCAVLEGHRFAVRPVAQGAALLSWGEPFGWATRRIAPGSYLCNARTLEELRRRAVAVQLPPQPNFQDRLAPYRLDELNFVPAEQVARYAEDRTFLGYRRGGQRGVGTRNYIVLLGVTSQVSSYVRRLQQQLDGIADRHAQLDGITAVAHTEGNSARANNHELLLRTLAGFLVHPNVAAALIVDREAGSVTNDMLRAFMDSHGYPLGDVRHEFLTLDDDFETSLTRGESLVRGWLAEAGRAVRTPQSLSGLKVALQCGGSDAFSGISGNPLAAAAAREVIRYGGAANLAETDELFGAESYVLGKVRSLETARKFLELGERFKQRAVWHSASAEGNPSGGNRYRGLYNITLKSLGAAMKRHPDVRLDHVIEYGERMLQPGFCFMDSPGNDLESVAGQVAAGCNLIFFITGSGSITNFPFVPTIKVATTTGRFQLLSDEMDVNAGSYLDGQPMSELCRSMLRRTIEIASGALSAGEKAGHSQVQIWRNWQQGAAGEQRRFPASVQPAAQGFALRTEDSPAALTAQVRRIMRLAGTLHVNLILPTSLCAGQIARMAAERMNQQPAQRGGLRHVALVHTEGCGVSSGSSEELFVRSLLGYAAHPLVAHCLFLEHGCEKTHNGYLRAAALRSGLDPARYGWASVQHDGGIRKVLRKIEDWFASAVAAEEPVATKPGRSQPLRVGLFTVGPVTAEAAWCLAQLTKAVVAGSGVVVVPQTADLLFATEYLDSLFIGPPGAPTVAYAQPTPTTGFHIMETPTEHWVETLSGLGAAGVHVVVLHVAGHGVQGHPFIPVLQISTLSPQPGTTAPDLDLLLDGDRAQWPALLLRLLEAALVGDYQPKLQQRGNVEFQITRGLLGISL